MAFLLPGAADATARSKLLPTMTQSSVRRPSPAEEMTIVPPPPIEPLEILLQDHRHFLVVNKPASVVCHHSEWTGIRKKSNISSNVNSNVTNDNNRNEIREIDIPILQRVRQQTGRRVNLVHRLDRGASGCLLLTYADDKMTDTNSNETDDSAAAAEKYADCDSEECKDSDKPVDLTPCDSTSVEKSDATHENNTLLNANIVHSSTAALMDSTAVTALFSQAMANKTTCTKTYVALVRGEGILHDVDFKEQGWFLVDRPIKNEKGVEKNASTWIRFVASQHNERGTLDRPRASLVLARPTTGRWHQIRKHLNGLSHPILGDTTHGSSRVNREWREKWGLIPERTCLHLCRLQI